MIEVAINREDAELNGSSPVVSQASAIIQTEFANFRDLGGVPAGPGRTFRPGVVFRTQALVSPSPETVHALTDLGLTDLVDLRMDRERVNLPVVLPFAVSYVIADVAADLVDNSAEAAGAAMSQKSASTKDFVPREAPPGGKDAMIETYRKFVEVSSAKAGYASFVRCVINADGATAVFCAAGKDRTGWAAAFLQSFMGVEDSAVVAAYTESNINLVKRYAQATQDVRNSGGDVEGFLALINANPDYLDAAFTLVKSKYGDVEGYLINGLGLTESELVELEGRLVS